MKSCRVVLLLTALVAWGCSEGNPVGLVSSGEPEGAIAPSAAGKPAVFPSIVPLPEGFRPEGIAVGNPHTFFCGSLADGRIYRGDLRTGQGAVIVPPQGRPAVGLSYDDRGNRLFVSGGGSGTGSVVDAGTGAVLAVYAFATAPTFVNDVVVTRDAAYFTDSFRPHLYRVSLGPAGELPAPAAFDAIPLGGDFVMGNGFNANGIDATPNGKQLVIVSQGNLYRVDPNSGEAGLIDLGGDSLPRGDGILLDGRDLYVVQNSLNQIAVVNVDAGLTSGTIERVITDGAFRVPTTIAEFGASLYAVNARFGTPPTPTTDYDVVRVSKR